MGIGIVPQGRWVFPSLTVQENIMIGAGRPGEWNLAEIYKLFPRLEERSRHLGNKLSGGEQQMLAIARALMTNPDLLSGLDALLPRLAHLGYLADYTFHTYLEQITMRLGELEIYVECVQALKTLLDGAGAGLHSVGLLRLREWVSTLAAGEDFRFVVCAYPGVRQAVPEGVAGERCFSVRPVPQTLDIEARSLAGFLANSMKAGREEDDDGQLPVFVNDAGHWGHGVRTQVCLADRAARHAPPHRACRSDPK